MEIIERVPADVEVRVGRMSRVEIIIEGATGFPMEPAHRMMARRSRPSRRLQTLYDAWNTRYWGGKLPRHEVRLFPTELVKLGHCSGLCVDFEVDARAVDEPGHSIEPELHGYIFVVDVEGAIRETILMHEMVHLVTGHEHEAAFVQELERLRAAGHPDAEYELEIYQDERETA